MINSDFVKKRVVIYARVSTEHEAQISALENQMDWYRPILAARPEWTLVGQYVDESAIIGLSQNPVQTGGDLALFFLFSAQFSANEGVPA